jgi:hypothetical protein
MMFYLNPSPDAVIVMGSLAAFGVIGYLKN